MELKVIRDQFTEKSTLGTLLIDSEFFCFTLEDRRRADGVKVKHETCIQPGTYEVAITFSNRFRRMLPLLLNVPGFDGIRIHPGNTNVDTSGCLLVGKTRGTDVINSSRLAFDALFAKIKAAINRGEKVFIEITEERGVKQ